MGKKLTALFLALLIVLSGIMPAEAKAGGLYNKHGRLSVKGTQIVDKNGKAFVLKGASTHGLSWYPEYVNKKAFKTLRSYGANCVRLAMYTSEYNGYCTGGNKTQLENLVAKGVKYATELNMYVIIDWHILNDGNPKTYQSQAVKFFKKMAKKYKNNGHVIYEICNEPNGCSWSDVKSYAKKVIKTIRTYDKKNLIIVGTPTWSQDVDVAAQSKLSGKNLVYACHFYAATHKKWLRQKITAARKKGLCVMISEYSITDASGSGTVDKTSAKAWAKYIDKYKMSYIQWSLCNKNEKSAIIKSSCAKKSGWTSSNLTTTGKYFKSRMK